MSRDRRSAIALAICALALLLAPVAEAAKAPEKAVGAPNGPLLGQLNGNATDVAVNRTGAGGAGVGDFYVVEAAFAPRIQQFDAEGNAIRAFGWDVVASGPDNVTPVSAVQSVNVPATVTGGTFTLSFNGKTSSALAFNANAAQVQSALTALSSIGAGNVSVSGGPGASAPYSIAFSGALAGTPVAPIVADSTNLTGGVATVSVTTAGVSGFEICNPTDVCKAGVSFSGAGALSFPQGIAVDQTNGNLYVSDAENHRIDVFSAVGSFEGAFGWGVTSGSNALEFCATTCLAGLSGGGGGEIGSTLGYLDVAPAGSPSAGDVYLADSGNNRIDQFKPTLSAGIVTGATFVRAFGFDVVASGPDNVTPRDDIQTITIPPAVTGGSFAVRFEGQSTSSLKFNATATELKNALNNLTAISGEEATVDVSGGAGAPYSITFRGFLGKTDVPSVAVDDDSLTGGEAAVGETRRGVSEYEICKPTDVCKAGTSGGREGQLTKPRDVGVDSSGAVYVVDGGNCFFVERCRVGKLSATGVVAGEFAAGALTGHVTSSGETSTAAPAALAIDPSSDHVFVAKKNSATTAQVLELDSSGNLLDTSPSGGGLASTNLARHGLAVGTAERLYLSSWVSELTSEVFILGPPAPPTAIIGSVTEVGTTTATFHGIVKPPAPKLGVGSETFYRFEYSTDGVSWSRVPAEEDADVGDGTGAGSPNSCPIGNPPSCNVEQKVTGLQPNATYQVRLVATTGTPATSATATFTTAPAAPSVSETRAEAVTATAAKLSGYVNPNNSPTTYHFEWGATTAYGNEVPNFDAFTGAGGKAAKVSAPISGLVPHIAYHFRIVATNASGETKGPDQEFFTLNEAGLPSNRAAELVSPPDKRPQGQVATILGDQLKFQAAEDGGSFFYPINNGLLDSTVGGELRYHALRQSTGWQSTQVSAPALITPPRTGLESRPSIVHYYTPGLSCGLMESFQPLTPDVPKVDTEQGVTNLFLVSPESSYTLITKTPPTNPSLEVVTTSYYNIAGASADCSRIFFQSEYNFLADASGLYEWSGGALRDVGRLPDETRAGETGIGGAIEPTVASQVNAVSGDGQRFFFSAKSNAGKDSGRRAVFVREGGSTVDASQSTTATAPLGARYEMASADGSHVFFAANYGLTAVSSSGPSADCTSPFAVPGAGPACDLYDYNTNTKTLSNLSADANPANSKGAVAEGVLDVSEDGSYVYFAALGQLTEGEGNTYKKNLGSGFANVYLAHGGGLAFVGVVTGADLNNGVLARRANRWTAQATPDGKQLLFPSSANVTGYVSAGAQEAYLYSATSGKTVCVSCRPDGKPSLAKAGETPIARTDGALPEQYYFPRSISEDGRRVFFTTRDALASGAVEGSRNVYEWEKGQVYLLNNGASNGEFLDASASGDDVFIRTVQQLDAHDTDFVRDVYDLRVGGGFPPPPPPPVPCDPIAKDNCQGNGPAPAPPVGAGSESLSGPGNPPAQPPGKKAQHKKKHHKKAHKKKQHKRAAHNNRGGGK